MTSRLIEERTCDKCGHTSHGASLDDWSAILVKRRTHQGPLNITPTGFPGMIDLCPLCLQQFTRWMTGDGKGPNWPLVHEFPVPPLPISPPKTKSGD